MTSNLPSRKGKDEVILDTGPCIYLDALGYMPQLSQYFRMYITPVVVKELKRKPGNPGSTLPGSSFVVTKRPNPIFVRDVGRALKQDQGEISVIALAVTLKTTVVIDETAARKFVKKIRLKTTGTLGMLLSVHQLGLTRRKLRTDIQRLRKAGMYVSEVLEQDVIMAYEQQKNS